GRYQRIRSSSLFDCRNNLTIERRRVSGTRGGGRQMLYLPRLRRLTIWPAVAAISVAMVVASPATASVVPGPAAKVDPAVAKVDPAVAKQITTNGPTTFYVLLNDQADLGRAGTLRAHADRTRYVYQTKTAYADRTQAGLRAMLSARGASF